MNLFQLGNFTLNSGVSSPWKIDCDSLTDGDIDALAQMIRQLVQPFVSVEGVPQGGLRLAKSLERFVAMNGPHLIVDDVLTTGGSMERTKIDAVSYERIGCPLPRLCGHPWIIGAVIFARGQRPPWVRAVFQMPEELWIKPKGFSR